MNIEHCRMAYFLETDFEKINHLLNFYYCYMPSYGSGLNNLIKLEKILYRATIVSPEKIPPTIVTLNSAVTLIDIKTGAEMYFTLSLPSPADSTTKRISLFSTFGCAVIGCRTGDVIEVEIPEGRKRFFVTNITNAIVDTAA
ncbi:MAG: hypothetical protein GY868_14170 [Deltaproteobacteria bacterium]|nr:hypothetical protein [Deltaproteobacteria bacterium]